jgi:hypothetical protein
MAKRTYEEALHAMQAGVAIEQSSGSQDGTPKHLRVGINARACDHAALVRLLIAKGVFTEDEYMVAITDEMNAEAERYEFRLMFQMGKKISLV